MPAARVVPAAAAAPAPGGAPHTFAVAPFATLGTGPAGAGIGPALARAVAGGVGGEGMQVVGSPGDARFTIDGGVQQVGPRRAGDRPHHGHRRQRCRAGHQGRRNPPRTCRPFAGRSSPPSASDWRSLPPRRPPRRVAEPANQLARDFLERRAAAWRLPEPAAPPARERFDAAGPGSLPEFAGGGDEPAETAVASLRSVSANPVAVLTFDELGASANDVRGVSLGRVITDTVTARLADLPEVTIVTLGEDAVWTVGGGIQRVGDVVRVTARVVEISSGAVVSSVKVDGSVAELADLQNRVAAAVTRGVADALARGGTGGHGHGAQR